MIRKRAVITLLCAFVIATGAFAQETDSTDSEELGPLMAPGDLAITAGVGAGFFWGAIDVTGGLEVMVSEFQLSDLPITVGVAGKFNYYRFGYTAIAGGYYQSYLGGAGYATAHTTLRSFNIDPEYSWLFNLDFYVGAGAGFYQYQNTYFQSTGTAYNEFRIGLRTTGGLNYFFTDNLALVFEGGYYGDWGGGVLMLLIKL